MNVASSHHNILTERNLLQYTVSENLRLNYYTFRKFKSVVIRNLTFLVSGNLYIKKVSVKV